MSLPINFEAITKADVKAYFGYTETGKDGQIDIMLPIAASRIREYCRNDFNQVQRTDELPKVMPNSDTFFVDFRPITTLDYVKEDGVALVEGTDFVCYKDEGRFVKCQEISENFTRPYGGTWLSQLGKIKVKYTGGDLLTWDVVQVFYETVGIFTGIRTRAYINNAGVENVVSLNNLPPEFLAILDLHKKARKL